MASPVVERLTTLMRVRDDSLRDAGERCGLDHTTVARVVNGETENGDTLAAIADGYGVPISWLTGEPDLWVDFAVAVVTRPLRERIGFMLDWGRRAGFMLNFLRQYNEGRYSTAAICGYLRLPESEVSRMLAEGRAEIPKGNLGHLCKEIGMATDWLETGIVGWEDEEELLVGLAEWVITSMAERLEVDVSEDEVREAALALVK